MMLEAADLSPGVARTASSTASGASSEEHGRAEEGAPETGASQWRRMPCGGEGARVAGAGARGAAAARSDAGNAPEVAADSPSVASSSAVVVRDAEAAAYAQLFDAWRQRGTDAATSTLSLGHASGSACGDSSEALRGALTELDAPTGGGARVPRGAEGQRGARSGGDGGSVSQGSSGPGVSEVERLREAVAKLESEKRETGRFLVQVAAEWEAAKANYEASESIFGVREKRYRDRETKLANDRKELLQEIGALKSKGESLQRAVDVLQMKEQEWAEKEGKWMAERKQLKASVRELQAAAKKEAGQREAAHCDLTSLKAEMQAWQMQERQWEERRQKWKVKKENLHTLVSSLQADVNRIVEERDALAQESRSLAENNAAMQCKLDALQSEMAALQSATAKDTRSLQHRLRETEAALLEEATKASAAQIEVMELTLSGSLASSHPAPTVKLHELQSGLHGLRAVQRGLLQDMKTLQEAVAAQIGALLWHVSSGTSSGGGGGRVSAGGRSPQDGGGVVCAPGHQAASAAPLLGSPSPSPFMADISCITEQSSSAAATPGLISDWGNHPISPTDSDIPAQIEGAIPNWQYLLAKDSGATALWGPLAQVFLQDATSPEARHAKALRQKWTDERISSQPCSDFAIPPDALCTTPSSTGVSAASHALRESDDLRGYFSGEQPPSFLHLE